MGRTHTPESMIVGQAGQTCAEHIGSVPTPTAQRHRNLAKISVTYMARSAARISSSWRRRAVSTMGENGARCAPLPHRWNPGHRPWQAPDGPPLSMGSTV